MKPDCYQCKHRRDIPGDTHSSCRHPALNKLFNASLSEIIMILGKETGLGDIVFEAIKDIEEINNKFQLKGNDHGIKEGWFIWPFNFDPVWLDNCNAFEASDYK